MAKVLPQQNAGAQFLAIINSYPLLKYFDVKPSHTVTFSYVCFMGDYYSSWTGLSLK